ncbi:adenosylcobinamide-GDP ribazoletransferase [Streptomyces sp. B6B3]|uniref:adenosylcobinamide-GDP ribazoletransferase n=1 Tax=Streptomyces sp. B6B3 TaxID=3153570 RepID=UPI00325C7BF7
MNATPPPPPAEPPRATGTDALRFAFGTLTVLPVGTPRWDRNTARRGMLCAPVAGAALGLAAAALVWLLLELEVGWLLTAVVTVALGSVLSRALHLDGLADTADALGSGRPAADALAIMRRSDIGPFGVATLVFALLAQVAALYEILHHGTGHGVLAAFLTCLAGRTALTWACREGVPAARTEGLGATVAGSVPVRSALGVAGTACAVAFLLGAMTGEITRAVAALCAMLLALSAAELLLHHCRRRLGGVTGDVLGAVAETAGTAALLVLAVTA